MAGWRPVSSSRTLTVAGQRPRSGRLSGRIRICTIRPAPECVGASGFGVALPVSRYWPGLGSASTLRRIMSHTGGNRCHSSTRTGRDARSRRAGSACNRSRWPASSRANTVAARRVAVAVLPTPLGPSKDSAAMPGSRASSSSSTTRGRYTMLASLSFAGREHYHWHEV